MIAAIALLLAQATAIPAPPPSMTNAAVSPEAMAFAEQYVPADLTIRGAVVAFRHEAERALTQQPAIESLERRHPGARRRLVDAGAVAMERSYRDRLPAMQRRIAAVAGADLSAADLIAVTRFIASPTGQAMQRAVAANVDTAKIAAAARDTGRLSADQITGAIDIAGSLQAMSPRQIAELAAFGGTPTGQRFQRIVPKLQTTLAEETTALAQAGNPAIQQAIMMTMRSMAAPGQGK